MTIRKISLLLSALCLLFGPGLASALPEPTTVITAGNTLGAGAAPIVAGTITFKPTDLAGNPIMVSLAVTGGGLVLPEPLTCLIATGLITGAQGGGACQLVDTSKTNAAHFCYATTVYDSVRRWTAPVMPCLQPTGSTWSLDSYVPNAGPTAVIVSGPTGATGPEGATGATGSQGATGQTGPQGPTGATGSAGPANTLGVGTVQTLTPGSSATATITGTAPSQTLNLGIPQGNTGNVTLSSGSAGQIAVLASPTTEIGVNSIAESQVTNLTTDLASKQLLTTLSYTGTSLDDTLTGWKPVCVLPSCNPGGVNTPASTNQTIGNTSPSDSTFGSMLLESVTLPTSTQTNVLWVNKAVPSCDTCTDWYPDFWFYLASNASAESSDEFDTASYDSTDELDFMFGTQCNKSLGKWQIANNPDPWVTTSASCNLTLNAWHHYQAHFYRIVGDTSCTGGMPCEYFDYVEIDGVKNALNMTVRATTLTTGWASSTIIQFQTDIGATTGTAITVDKFIDNIQLIATGPKNFMPVSGGAFTGAVTGPTWNNLSMYESAANNNTNLGGLLPTTETGQGNLAIGAGTLNALTSGTNDLAAGVGALYYLTTGSNDAAYGLNALQFDVSGSGNSGFGVGALNKTTGGSDTAVGNNAGADNTIGASRVAIGAGAGVNSTTANATGSYNTYIGAGANDASDGLTNTSVIGYNAQATQSNQVVLGNSGVTQTVLHGNVIAPTVNGAVVTNPGNGNVNAAGSLPPAVTGANNTSTGSGSLAADSSGYSNSAFGLNALTVNTTGYENDAFGVGALAANTTGNDNIADGKSALATNTTGAGNTAMGAYAGYNSGTPTPTTSYSVFIGENANNSADGFTNDIVLGYNAQATQSNEVVIGNTAITQTVLRGNVLASTVNSVPLSRFGTGNTSLGGSLQSSATGTNNTAVGSGAGYADTTGSSNTAVGLNALNADSTGGSNTAAGVGTLAAMVSGGANTALGNNALAQNQTGGQNTAVGYGAGMNSTTPDTSGANNTFVGVNANNASAGLTNTVVVGFNAQATASNTIMIGNSSITSACFAGGRMCWYSASGTPSASLCAASNIGSFYSNTNGGAATTLYVCTAAATWTAK